MRVTAAFSSLLGLQGAPVRDVCFEPDGVIVKVALRRRRLICPLCSFSTPHRHEIRPVDSDWRHLDLGVWRLEVRARLRRLVCPEHGVRTEQVAFARYGSDFTRDFEALMAWLATRTDKTTVTRMLRIHWRTVGRIVQRVGADELDRDRLDGLVEIGIDECPGARATATSPSSPIISAANRLGAEGASATVADDITVAIGGKVEAGKPQPGRVVALEDLDTFAELCKLLEGLQLGATHEIIPSTGMVQLNRPNSSSSADPASRHSWRRSSRRTVPRLRQRRARLAPR